VNLYKYLFVITQTILTFSLIIDVIYFCDGFSLITQQQKWLFSNTRTSYFLQFFLKIVTWWSNLGTGFVYSVQKNYGKVLVSFWCFLLSCIITVFSHAQIIYGMWVNNKASYKIWSFWIIYVWYFLEFYYIL